MIATQVKQRTDKPLYKYLHSGCAKVAYYTSEIKNEHPVKHCKSCHLPLDFISKGQFIKLTPEEISGLSGNEY